MSESRLNATNRFVSRQGVFVLGEWNMARRGNGGGVGQAGYAVRGRCWGRWRGFAPAEDDSRAGTGNFGGWQGDAAGGLPGLAGLGDGPRLMHLFYA